MEYAKYTEYTFKIVLEKRPQRPNFISFDAPLMMKLQNATSTVFQLVHEEELMGEAFMYSCRSHYNSVDLPMSKELGWAEGSAFIPVGIAGGYN